MYPDSKRIKPSSLFLGIAEENIMYKVSERKKSLIESELVRHMVSSKH